jgi:hypothetical protein
MEDVDLKGVEIDIKYDVECIWANI